MTYTDYPAKMGNDYLSRAKDTMSTGDFDGTLKWLNCARSYSPSAEGLVMELECHIGKGSFSEISDNIDVIVAKFQQLPAHELLVGRLENAINIIKSEVMADNGVMINEPIEVQVPVCFKSRAQLNNALVNLSSENSTDMQTLLNKSGKVIYDLEIQGKNRKLTDLMITQCRGRLSNDQRDYLKKHTHIISLLGPSHVLACSAETQLDLVTDLLKTVSVLLPQVQAPALHVCTSGLTVPTNDWVRFYKENSLRSFISAFVVFIRSTGNSIVYSCGMHAFGLADAVFPIISDAQESVEVTREFLEFSLINELSPGQESFQYHSAVCGRTIDAEWQDECVYAESGFFNQYGTWMLKVT